jgi:hypothetical protein
MKDPVSGSLSNPINKRFRIKCGMTGRGGANDPINKIDPAGTQACPNCGKQIPDGSKFCPYCGASLEEKANIIPKAKSLSRSVSKIVIPIVLIIVILVGVFVFVKFIKPNITPNTKKETIATLIPYRKGDKWGYCDRNKKIVIPIQYDGAMPFNEGLARVKVKGKWGYIDTKGTQYWED